MLRALLHHMALLGTAQGVGLSGAEGGAATDFSVLRWGYLPTVSTVRFMVFPPASAATAAQQYDLRLTGSAGGVIAKTAGPLPTPTHGVSWRVPPLGSGVYTLHLRLLDGTGGVAVTYVDSFNRTVQPWENSSLGREDVLYGMVIPPWTPIEAKPSSAGAKRASLGFLGREVELHNATGLWSQVVVTPPMTPRVQRGCPQCEAAPSRHLLAGPVELVVSSGGTVHRSAASGSGTLDVKVEGHRAETRSTWSLGPLSGSTSAQYDYDGCGRFLLTLHPTAQPVDWLQLVVPLRLSEARLLHTVTDYIRENFAGSIPPGEGDVYNTTDITRYQLPGPFVPYIFVGGAERGVAFFAVSATTHAPLASSSDPRPLSPNRTTTRAGLPRSPRCRS